MDTRNAIQVKQSGWEVVWHIREAAVILQHAVGHHWGNLTAVQGTTPEEVLAEQSKCQNVIGDICDQFKRFLQVANSREEVDPDSLIEKLIETCNLVLGDKHVGLREILEERGRERSQGEKPAGSST